jgi:predicted hotdog family 3-hydroxylacyl-ACP dehydratase
LLIKAVHSDRNNSLIDFSNVAGLIPHSGQMVLLDRVVKFDQDGLVAEMTVRENGLFGNKKEVPAWVGIEYMAQAVAAHVGIKSKLAGKPISLGYLLGTRRYNSNVPNFAVGSALTIKITTIIQDEKLGVFDCTIRGVGIEVNANLNVYQPPIDIPLESLS